MTVARLFCPDEMARKRVSEVAPLFAEEERL